MKKKGHLLAVASNCMLFICALFHVMRLISKGLCYDAAFAVIISAIVYLMVYHEIKGTV